MSTNEKIRKTDAARQKALYARRKANGWRKTWVDPGTLDVAKRLGGIENIAENVAETQVENDRLRQEALHNLKRASELAEVAQEAQEKAKKLQSEIDKMNGRTFWQKLRDVLPGDPT